MASRGRPRKPDHIKALEGNPGKRPLKFNEPTATGEPLRPEGLSEQASWMWDHVVTNLTEMGLAKSIDTPMLWSMCELWGLYRAAIEAAKDNPTDRTARTAVQAYWSKFEVAASRFGLDPSSRSKLQAAPDGGENPLKKFGIAS